MQPLRNVFPKVIWLRWQNATRNSIMAAVAGTIAWIISIQLFGHPKPLFAIITAIICLAPGLPNHGLQGVSVVLGATTGIIVGEIINFFPADVIAWKLLISVPIAMILASSFGLPTVVMVQSGMSAVLVLTFGPETAGLNRLEDVLAGSVVGLLFSQVLLTPDPVAKLNSNITSLLTTLSSSVRQSAKALADNSEEDARITTGQVFAAHEQLIQLDAAILSACSNARWSLRGRINASSIYNIATVYDRRLVRLYASVLLLAEAVGAAMRCHQREEADLAPTGLVEAIYRLSDDIDLFAKKRSFHIPLPLCVEKIDSSKPGNIVWQRCLARVEDVYVVLQRIEEIRKKDNNCITAAELD